LVFNAITPSTPLLEQKYIVYTKGSYSITLPGKDIIYMAASSRIMNAADIQINLNQYINIGTIKALTGLDNIEGIKVSTTILGCMNKLPYYETMMEHTAADKVCRMSVVPTRDISVIVKMILLHYL